MQNQGRIIIVLIILNIIVLAFIIVVPNFMYAQELHNQTLYKITKQTPQIAHITVGRFPVSLAVDEDTNRIYVANTRENTVSVINGTTNTAIGKPIPVGNGPNSITVIATPGNFYRNGTSTIYVVNGGDNTVSVINGTTRSMIVKPIPVGEIPVSIAVDEDTNTIYVANTRDNTVSVINGTTNTVIGKPIPVGKFPTGVDALTGTIYVANQLDNTVSVINGTTRTMIVKPIPVGNNPYFIGANRDTDTIYVANYRNTRANLLSPIIYYQFVILQTL